MSARCISLAALLLLPSLGLSADRLNNREAAGLYQQISNLMEATRIVLPEMARAGAPLSENFKQGSKTLTVGPSRAHTGVIYSMLGSARVYLQLLDALPKPAEFSDESQQQIQQLRAQVDRLDRHFRATLDYREQQALGSDRDNLRRYAEANRRDGPPLGEEQRVVFLGDSITDGWKINQYFPGKPYLNRGISGQITGQMLGRMQPDVIAMQPEAMVVLGGTNDLARGVSDETIRHNLEMIGSLAAAAGIRPVLASILPISDYHEKVDASYKRSDLRDPARIHDLNRWLEDTCRQKGWVYLDYFSAVADDAGRLGKELARDGLHPNAEGYKIMAPLAEAAIAKALAPQTKKRRRRGN